MKYFYLKNNNFSIRLKFLGGGIILSAIHSVCKQEMCPKMPHTFVHVPVFKT